MRSFSQPVQGLAASCVINAKEKHVGEKSCLRSIFPCDPAVPNALKLLPFHSMAVRLGSSSLSAFSRMRENMGQTTYCA